MKERNWEQLIQLIKLLLKQDLCGLIFFLVKLKLINNFDIDLDVYARLKNPDS